MRILVTRPEPDASATGEALKAMGHEVVMSSLMDVRLIPVADIGPGAVQALIFTSRNAVRAVATSPALPGLLELPVFAVGPGTTKDARDLGFHGVITGPGNAAGLVDVVQAEAAVEGGRLIHFAGFKLAFDLEGALRANGYQVDTIRCYEAQRAKELSPEAVDALRSGHLDAVLMMSPEASRTYIQLVETARISEAARNTAYVCISEATAEALLPLNPSRIQVSSKPSSQEVLALINRMSDQSRP
jgi:uroporphyrinogen-III synthase